MRAECAATLQAAATYGFHPPPPQLPPFLALPFAPPAAAPSLFAEDCGDGDGEDDIVALLAQADHGFNTLSFLPPPGAVRFFLIVRRARDLTALAGAVSLRILHRPLSFAGRRRREPHRAALPAPGGRPAAVQAARASPAGRQVPRRHQRAPDGPLHDAAAPLQHVRALTARAACLLTLTVSLLQGVARRRGGGRHPCRHRRRLRQRRGGCAGRSGRSQQHLGR
jgi:hypothetical protein